MGLLLFLAQPKTKPNLNIHWTFGYVWKRVYRLLRWAIWTALSPMAASGRGLGWIVLAKRILKCTSRCERNMLTELIRSSHVSRSQRMRSTRRAKAKETPVIINSPRNLKRVIGFNVSSAVYGSWFSNHLFSISISLSLVLRFKISLDTRGTSSWPFWNIWKRIFCCQQS